MLKRPEVRAMIPEGRQIAFSANRRDPQDPESPYEMIVLKAEPELRGEVVTDAIGTTDIQTGQPVVQMSMDLFGAERWAQITEDNVNKRVAVVLDSAVYSAPWIEEKIPGGHTRITGSADLKEAELLATVLKSGALKAPIRIIEERIVGPSLGQDQIDQGVNAVLFAALLVVLFMIVYYMFGGLVADIAVVINVFLTLAVLAAFQGTLTLPGIGALVLTIGMAVDANILIYERIREELALGKGLRHAVQLGYEKAFTAIIDSNITTFITGVILYSFGSGPIKGFALMLMIGIGATLFTAVFITRAVFMVILDRGVENINFGQPKTKSVS
jgi:preprotein translocase subunit SecD